MLYPDGVDGMRASEMVGGLMDLGREIVSLPPDEREKRVRGLLESMPPEELNEEWGRVREFLGSEYRGMLEEIQGKERKDDVIRRIVYRPEILFFVRVFIPCVVLQRDYPARVLRRARQGDLEALCFLLKVDKAVVHDAGIAEIIHREGQSRQKGAFNRIARAFGSLPKKLSRKRAKIMSSRFISDMFGPLGDGLGKPDIQHLYDAIAAARMGREVAVDEDLPDSPETFAKAVQREEPYSKLLPARTKINPKVSG